MLFTSSPCAAGLSPSFLFSGELFLVKNTAPWSSVREMPLLAADRVRRCQKLPMPKALLLGRALLAVIYISITKDKITDSEAVHFTTESGWTVVAYGWMTTLSTFPDDVLSADIGVLLLVEGVFVSGMAIAFASWHLQEGGRS